MSFKILTEAQVQAFMRDGFIVLPEAFDRKVAEGCVDMIWEVMEEDREDSTTWKREGLVVQQGIKGGPASQVMTRRYVDAIGDLVGHGRDTPGQKKGFGYPVIRFPVDVPIWEPRGWHIDGNWFHHHVDSAEQGLVGVDIFTDIDLEGGGTAIRVGSHHIAARIFGQAEPDGFAQGKVSTAVIPHCEDCPIIEVTGRAGDALLMHPHLLHASSTNRSRRVRIIANRAVSLHEPMQFDRPNPADLSPVEAAVAQSVIG